jgi:sec-independent protein translocase protein TatA
MVLGSVYDNFIQAIAISHNSMNLPLAQLDGPILWAIIIVAVLLFGGSKIPELARGLGRAKREFKKASEDVSDEVRNVVDEDDRRQARLRAIEEEERAKIRARIEQEERNKRSGEGHKN